MKIQDLIESSRRRDEAAYRLNAFYEYRTSEPLFREIAAVAVEALGCDDPFPTSCGRCYACEALSKIQSLIDEAEKK